MILLQTVIPIPIYDNSYHVNVKSYLGILIAFNIITLISYLYCTIRYFIDKPKYYSFTEYWYGEPALFLLSGLNIIIIAGTKIGSWL